MQPFPFRPRTLPATYTPATFTFGMTGDVMLGRIIDQLLPTPLHSPADRAHALHFQSTYPHLRPSVYGYAAPWGDVLPLMRNTQGNFVNLETAVTREERKWEGKVFNYRTHPLNVKCLQEANVVYTSLANNHTLDYGIPGLLETIRTVEDAGITYAGASTDPTTTTHPHYRMFPHTLDPSSPPLRIAFLSASDHPHLWGQVPNFHFLDIEQHDYTSLSKAIPLARKGADLVVFSVHWGPNYSWRPSRSIVRLARWLIDAGVDIVHGHSSHHLQGVEVYKGKLVVYGCGDFVDDYRVEEEFRNDLGGFYMVRCVATPRGTRAGAGHGFDVKVTELDIVPTRIAHMQVNRLKRLEGDWEWVRDKTEELTREANGGRVGVEEVEGGVLRVKVDG